MLPGFILLSYGWYALKSGKKIATPFFFQMTYKVQIISPPFYSQVLLTVLLSYDNCCCLHYRALARCLSWTRKAIVPRRYRKGVSRGWTAWRGTGLCPSAGVGEGWWLKLLKIFSSTSAHSSVLGLVGFFFLKAKILTIQLLWPMASNGL